MSKEVVEANYVLKTCGFPPTGMQFKAGMNQDTVCGDPTGQTDCATECSEEIPPLNLGESCYYDDECASGSCRACSCLAALPLPSCGHADLSYCCSPPGTEGLAPG